jgi:hypothetical protein
VVTLGKHELVYVDERLPMKRSFSDTVPGVQAVESGETPT